MAELKKVNVFCGRFQPFHAGHLKCCEDAYKENGYPTFIFYTPNKQFDARKPFDDKLIEEEYAVLVKNYDYIEGYDWMQHPMPVRMCRILKEQGYEAVLWLAGEDRINTYKQLLTPASIDKITNELEVPVPEIFQTNRYGSATAVREALKTGNKEEYIKLMPKGTEHLYDKFKEQVDSIKEGMKSIKDYILEKLQYN